MANCSIPNSILATGRISTKSSRQSKKGNNARAPFREAFNRANAVDSWELRSFNAEPAFARLRRGRLSTPSAQRSIQTVELPARESFRSWILGTACSPWRGRWTFSSSGRVKGAWWPSRSSKPPSPRKWRGRFDSYPLRQFIFERR